MGNVVIFDPVEWCGFSIDFHVWVNLHTEHLAALYCTLPLWLRPQTLAARPTATQGCVLLCVFLSNPFTPPRVCLQASSHDDRGVSVMWTGTWSWSCVRLDAHEPPRNATLWFGPCLAVLNPCRLLDCFYLTYERLDSCSTSQTILNLSTAVSVCD